MEVGSLIIGTINRIVPYGAFLEFDEGYRGLLHISEMSKKFIRDINRFAHVDDEIKVKVLEVDEEHKFLHVSLKQVPLNEKMLKRDGKLVEIKKNPIKTVDISKLQDKLDEWVDATLEENVTDDEDKSYT